MADIDHFKVINDTYGHQAGDTVLAEMAKILHSNFRDVDTVARYGGEEFVALLPHTPKIEAIHSASRVLSQVASYRFKGVDKGRQLTLSIGIAGIPDPVLSIPDKLIQCADFALYQAKQLGRNRVEMRDGGQMLEGLTSTGSS